MKRLLLLALLVSSTAYGEDLNQYTNLSQPIPIINNQQPIVNPNSAEARQSVDMFREPIPVADSRRITLEKEKTTIINTRPNFWTIIDLPFDGFDYYVGNPSIFEVQKKDNKVLIRPLKTFENSNLIIVKGNEIYQFILTQARDLPDLIVIARPKEKVDYEKELDKVLINGDKSDKIILKEYSEKEDYDKVIVVGNKKMGVKYVR